MSGQDTSLSCPRAVTRMLAVSSIVSPVVRFCTLIFLSRSQPLKGKNNGVILNNRTYHSFCSSSQAQCFTSWRVLMNLVAPNFSATSSRYFWISLPGAYRLDQFGLGANEY